MKQESGKRNVTYILFGVIILFIGAGVSLAFFVADVFISDNASSIIIQTGNLEITYDGTSTMSLNNSQPGDSVSKTITIENTGRSIVTTYEVNAIYLTNDFIKDELVYSFTCSSNKGSCDGISETAFPTTAKSLFTGTNLLLGEKRTYTVKLTLLDTGSDQNYNQTRELSFNIFISEHKLCTNDNLLSCKILSDNGGSSQIDGKSAPSFSSISPTSYTLYEGTAHEFSDGTSKYIADTNIYVATDYTFNSTNGYVLTSPVQVSNINTGSYNYYYTCYSSSITSCMTMYQISTTITGNYMINYKVFQAKLNTSNDGVNNQLYSTTDQDGKTYYYRGSVTNNYVKFGGLLWRIIRINGDGTIRLLLDDYAIDTNNNYYSVEYNASSSCTAPANITTAINCAKYGSGTYSSTSIKNYVDTWYTSKLSSYDAYIATSKYCVDYSYSGDGSGFTIFSGWQRIANDKSPKLTCVAASGYTNGTSETRTGKSGLITADELALAGGLWETNNRFAYFYINDMDWLTTTSDVWYGVSSGMTMLRYYSDINNAFLSYQKRFRPVINLLANTTVTGSGTMFDPYLV